jgi:hypothetical protein
MNTEGKSVAVNLDKVRAILDEVDELVDQLDGIGRFAGAGGVLARPRPQRSDGASPTEPHRLNTSVSNRITYTYWR